MKTAFAALAFLLAASAAACNTVEGVGEDVSAAGNAIDKTAWAELKANLIAGRPRTMPANVTAAPTAPIAAVSGAISAAAKNGMIAIEPMAPLAIL